MREIKVDSKLIVKIGANEGRTAKVTTIITTNRKRFYVEFDNGETTSYFYRHLKLTT